MTELELKKYSRNALLGSFVSMLTAGLATMMYSVCISTIRTDLALTAVQAGSLGTYTFMGQMLGGMVAGYLADRFGRKNILIVDVILATLAVFATSLLQSYSIFGLCLAFWANSSNILVLMLLYGVCYGMPTGIHATFIGECFPTHLRSTGVGFTFNIGRLGAFVAPILMGKLVDMNMISVAIATVTISYVLCSLATLPIKEREYDASNVAAQLED